MTNKNLLLLGLTAIIKSSQIAFIKSPIMDLTLSILALALLAKIIYDKSLDNTKLIIITLGVLLMVGCSCYLLYDA